jgi:vacuolar iron transporter family protein
MHKRHFERHYSNRTGWLRAAVLGANDGIVSTASLVVGIAAAQVAREELLVAAVAGLVAGAMSMAAGEYVSVSSQADTERADLKREKSELELNAARELEELANIYVGRGLDKALATTVADQLMAHDALGAHARDELGMSDSNRARPIQAALASAAAFSLGAMLPVVLVAVTPVGSMIPVVAGCSLALLGLLGATAAKAGGARASIGALRVTLWGAVAMAATIVIGHIIGAGP